jgi:hypothetical protein
MCVVAAAALGEEVSAVQDGDPAAGVSQRDRDVDGAVRDLHERAAAEGTNGIRSGRSPARSDCSAARAARLAERTTRTSPPRA